MNPTLRSFGLKSWLVVGVLASGFPAGAAARQAPAEATELLPVVEHVLDNGMRFLLLERPSAPIVSFALDVSVGSLDDPPGRKGTSHLLEHLLFKGTTSIGTRDPEAELAMLRDMDALHDSLGPDPDADGRTRLVGRLAALEDSARALAVPDEFSALYARHGARGLNATTGYHETRFTVSLPANRVELWFAMESDRFTNPVFRDFFAERRVVLEERRSRLESNPGAMLRAAALEAAFPSHGYGVHPLGVRDDLEALGRRDLESFFHAYFRPDRMTAAIVGDFDVDQVVAWAETYFGRLENPEAPPPPPASPSSSIQEGERRIEVTFEASPQVQIAWRIPPATHPDTPALLVLTNLLVGSGDAHLTRSLVAEDGPASSVVVDLGPGDRHPRLFTIQAAPRNGRSTEEVEAAVYDALDRLIRTPPAPEEIERLRTRLEAAEARGMVSSAGLAAGLLSATGLRGDWREIFATQAGMRSVESEDVLAVVERYLRPETRIVATLRPAAPGADP